MRATLWISAGMLAGGLIGAFTALALGGVTSGIDRGEGIEIGGWRSDLAVGRPASGPYQRIWLARHALLAPRRSEVLRFTRDADAAGRALTQGCSYRVSGAALPGSWWSVTLYDANGYLPVNGDAAPGFGAADTGGVEWSFIVAERLPDIAGARWVSSAGAGQFALMLRIYEPSQALQDDPARLRPPLVERLDCAGGAPA